MAICLEHQVVFHAEINEHCYVCDKIAVSKCLANGGHNFRPWHDMKSPDGVWEVRNCTTCSFGESRKK